MTTTVDTQSISNSQFGVYKGPKRSKNAQTENCWQSMDIIEKEK